jgi:uncharacterized protein YabE (DUF348 family)
MKFIKNRSRSKYTLLRTRGKEGLKRHPYVIPTFGLILGFFAVAVVFVSLGGQTVRPSDSRVVRVFIDGKERTVATRAQTVGELTQKLNLDLINEDIVEPASDAPITNDDMHINVYRAKAMTVIDGPTKKATLSAHKSPRLVAVQAGIEIFPEDKASFEQGNISEGIVGQKVVIDRAVPINLALYGAILQTRTQAQTVGEVLSEKSIKLNEGDTLIPAPETPVTEGMQVVISRFGQQIVVAEEEIPKPIQYVPDSSLPAGSRVVREPGSPGKKVVTYQIQLKNDIEIGRTIIQEVILTQPVKEVQAKGTKVAFADVSGQKAEIMAAAGISASNYGYVDYIIGKESRWNASASNSRGCWGLGQACPGSKLAIACPNWQNDPVCQLGWFSGYANGRYGGWAGAYSFWVSHHWW